MRRLLVPVACLAVAACGPTFDPPSLVDKLRLLAIRAEPPEIAAGGLAGLPDRASLVSLVADPAGFSDPSRKVTVLHLACTPDPLDPRGVDCTSIETLRDPAALAALVAEGGGDLSGTGVVGGVSLVGVESCDGRGPCGPATVDGGAGGPIPLPAPTYVLPPDLDLAALPEDHRGRVAGVVVSLVSLTIAAAPDELLAGDPGERLGELLAEREHVVAVKRIRIRGPEALDAPNVNPSVPGILAAGVPLPADPGEAPSFAPGAEVRLTPRPPAIPLDETGAPDEEAVFQRHTRVDQHGRPSGTVLEEWLYSWFATAGSFSLDRTRRDESCTWTAPVGTAQEPLPPGDTALLFLVVRDGRGGLDWAVRPLAVAAP